MGKRANPRALKKALTYEVHEVAAVLGKSPATIRNWIKDGLPVMSNKKPYLISGEALQSYLRAKNKAAKSPLAPDELYCLSCRAGRKPFDMTVETLPNTPKTIRLKGVCSRCGASASRMISKTKTQEFALTFHVKEGGSRDA